jgi:hypothetical protein
MFTYVNSVLDRDDTKRDDYAMPPVEDEEDQECLPSSR